MAKNYPFIHKTYMLCVLYVLSSEFLQWTQAFFWLRVFPALEANPRPPTSG
jgi:hypothetical protein